MQPALAEFSTVDNRIGTAAPHTYVLPAHRCRRESFQLGANMQLDIRRTLLPSVHPQYISVT
jgi:hypothetical protein